MTKDNIHVPVLLDEAINGLGVKPGGVYVDCNLGYGGHTSKIMEKGGMVIGFELDESAIEYCRKRFEDELKSGQLKIIHDNFVRIAEHINTKADGILYDLGLNTAQYKSNRGFSFDDDKPLDMRIDMNLNVTANDLIKVLSESELAKVISEYGEDPQAKRFAKAIKSLLQKIRRDPTAQEVANAIKLASAYDRSKLHPATRTFQALRIVVNSELDNLRLSVESAIRLLVTNGRLVIITFHSLEDSIAKGLAGSPILNTLTINPIEASSKEIENNRSARSAKLRIYEKN